MAVSSTMYDWEVLKSLGLGLQFVQLNQITSIATYRGLNRNCALLLTQSGKLFAIGKSSRGCLGLGEVTETAEPVELEELSGVAGVCVCGCYGDALAYTSEGKVYVWGNNVSWKRPQLVPELTDVVDARCRAGHYLALTKSGKLYEWRGVTTCCSKLGITTTLSTTPKVVTLNEVITSIACGPNHSLALTKDGQVYSWGKKYISSTCSCVDQPMTKITLPGETVAKIACGGGHSLVLTHSGKLYTWGRNGCGGLGDPSGRTESARPVQIGQNIGRFVDIAANGSQTNAAVSNTGEVYMWGDGENDTTVKTPTITAYLEMHQVFANIDPSNYSWTPKTPSSNTVLVKDSSSVAGKLKASCNDEQRAHLQLVNLIEKIKEAGKCPICLSLTRPPSKVCSNGHVMCKICVGERSSCPLCNVSFNSSVTAGNLNFVGLDNILNELPRTCENDINGCTFVDITHKMEKDHKFSCKKRLVTCRVKGCKWKNEFENLRSHLEEIHANIILTDGSKVSMQHTDNMYVVHPVLLGDVLLWKHVKANTESLYITLELYAANETQLKQCNTCVYTIKGIHNNFQFTFTGKVWREGYINNICQSTSLNIPVGMLSHIKGEENILNYTFEIGELI